MGRLSVVVGGMFGSESKGHVTARVAKESILGGETVTAVRVAGHNAGHTAYDDQERAWALRTIPVAAVSDPEVQLMIGAGSEVDHRVLISEIESLEEAGIQIRERLIVDPTATWLEQSHIDTEQAAQMHEKSGSTAKGVGAARASRIMRTARLIGEWDELSNYAKVSATGPLLRDRVANQDDHHVIIEGTQGYGLGLHTSHYPLTTSSDCRAIDFLAMAGIDPTRATEYEVWLTIRPYPIRVAGPSGALKGETSWEELGLPEERTTVTKKRRRVGSWDPDLVIEAVEENGGECAIALSMLDQVFPEVSGVQEANLLSQPVLDWIREREEEIGSRIRWVGTSPSTSIFLP